MNNESNMQNGKSKIRIINYFAGESMFWMTEHHSYCFFFFFYIMQTV